MTFTSDSGAWLSLVSTKPGSSYPGTSLCEYILLKPAPSSAQRTYTEHLWSTNPQRPNHICQVVYGRSNQHSQLHKAALMVQGSHPSKPCGLSLVLIQAGWNFMFCSWGAASQGQDFIDGASLTAFVFTGFKTFLLCIVGQVLSIEDISEHRVIFVCVG